jgi:hypothetical protein
MAKIVFFSTLIMSLTILFAYIAHLVGVKKKHDKEKIEPQKREEKKERIKFSLLGNNYLIAVMAVLYVIFGFCQWYVTH